MLINSRRIAGRSIAAIVAGLLACAAFTVERLHSEEPTLFDRLNSDKTLPPNVLQSLRDGSRKAASGKPFRILIGVTKAGSEVVLENGRLKMLKTSVGLTGAEPILTEFTAQPATWCDGTKVDGYLVLEYARVGGLLTARARQSHPVEAPSEYALTAFLSDGGLQDDGLSTDRSTRALRGGWKPPSYEVKQQWSRETTLGVGGGTISGGSSAIGLVPADPDLTGTQALWIDVRTLLPRRFELVIAVNPGRRGLQAIPLTYTFQFDNSIVLRRPAGVKVPNCI